jgi:DNA-binding response OmpR family regulator
LTTQFCRADQYSPLVTILVVDTNPTLVRALSLQLRECGYRALGATSFHEAQRMWDAEQPQVLVADVRLAAYNGLHLLIRARAVRPEVTAIITSPVPDRVLADETQRLGGTFLVKPVDVGDIVTAIEDLSRVPRRRRCACDRQAADAVGAGSGGEFGACRLDAGSRRQPRPPLVAGLRSTENALASARAGAEPRARIGRFPSLRPNDLIGLRLGKHPRVPVVQRPRTWPFQG